MYCAAQESEGSGSASSNRPSGSAGPLALAAPRSCSWPDRMSKYLRMTAPGNWTALTEREPSELKDSATASPGSRTGGAGLRQVEGEDGVLGVDGDNGDARPRARFGGDGELVMRPARAQLSHQHGCCRTSAPTNPLTSKIAERNSPSIKGSTCSWMLRRSVHGRAHSRHADGASTLSRPVPVVVQLSARSKYYPDSNLIWWT